MHVAFLLFDAEKTKVAPGTRMLLKRFRELGHRVTIMHEEQLQIRFGNHHRVYFKNKPLKHYDAILTRPGIKADPSIHAAVIRQIELDGQLVINGYLGVHRAKNKIRTLQLLDHFNLPIPKTVVAFGMEEAMNALKEFSFPVIVKAAYGSGGAGIFIAESKRACKPLLEYILGQARNNDPVKIQEYIKESKGKDIRVFVVGKRIATAMQRTAKKGDFRSNVHQGGKGTLAELSEEEKRISLEAAQRLGLNIAGVDILRTNNGPVIIEVNSYPGLKGITEATDVDVAGHVVKYVENKVSKRKRKIKRVREKQRSGEA